MHNIDTIHMIIPTMLVSWEKPIYTSKQRVVTGSSSSTFPASKYAAKDLKLHKQMYLDVACLKMCVVMSVGIWNDCMIFTLFHAYSSQVISVTELWYLNRNKIPTKGNAEKVFLTWFTFYWVLDKAFGMLQSYQWKCINYIKSTPCTQDVNTTVESISYRKTPETKFPSHIPIKDGRSCTMFFNRISWLQQSIINRLSIFGKKWYDDMQCFAL